jgi:hypothetical protein
VGAGQSGCRLTGVGRTVGQRVGQLAGVRQRSGAARPAVAVLPTEADTTFRQKLSTIHRPAMCRSLVRPPIINTHALHV